MVSDCIPNSSCIVAFKQDAVASMRIEVDAMLVENCGPLAVETYTSRLIEKAVEVRCVVRQLKNKLQECRLQTQVHNWKCWNRESECCKLPSDVEADDTPFLPRCSSRNWRKSSRGCIRPSVSVSDARYLCIYQESAPLRPSTLPWGFIRMSE